MLDIICIGDTTYDMFVKPHEAEILESHKKSRVHVMGEPMLCFGYGAKISIEEINYSLGGSACNVAVGLRKLGKNTGIASFAGIDNTGEKIKGILEKEDIDLSYFKTDRKISSSFSLILRYQTERTILIYRDKICDYSTLKLPKTKVSKWIYLSHLGFGYEKIYKHCTYLATEKGVKLALNPGKTQLENTRMEFKLILKIADVVIINKDEAQILAASRFPLRIEELFYKLSSFGIKNLVITDGKNGAYARGEDRKIIHQRAMSVDCIESTGAGDAFSAGFLANFIKTNNLNQALVWGVINGAKVTEKIGAQEGLLTEEEILKDISRHNLG